MCLKTWLLIAVLMTACIGSDAAAQMGSQLFADDRSKPLEPKVLSTQTRDDVEVYDLTYAGSKSRVPAYLLVPKGSGKFAAIVWAHWLMPGSPLQNRREFLDEAVALAPSGVVSLLIDAP